MTSNRIERAASVVKANVVIAPTQGLLADLITGQTWTAVGGTKAAAEVAGATINVAGLTIKVKSLSSTASSQVSSCAAAATTSGSSTVAGLTINGVQVVPNSGTSSPLGLNVGLVTVSLNEQVKSGNTITQTAVHLNVLGIDIALRRSIAGASCGG